MISPGKHSQGHRTSDLLLWTCSLWCIIPGTHCLTTELYKILFGHNKLISVIVWSWENLLILILGKWKTKNNFHKMTLLFTQWPLHSKKDIWWLRTSFLLLLFWDIPCSIFIQWYDKHMSCLFDQNHPQFSGQRHWQPPTTTSQSTQKHNKYVPSTWDLTGMITTDEKFYY